MARLPIQPSRRGYAVLDFSLELRPSASVVATDFVALGIDLRSYREPLKRAVQQVVAPSIRRNFDVGGRPPWEPLAENTVKQKAALGYTDKPLIRTRTLRRVAAQLNAWEITRDEARVVDLPNAEYGVFHHTGTRFMPERDFLTIQPDDERQIEQVFERWIVERFMRRAFIGAAFGVG